MFEARRDVLRLSDKQPNRNKLPALILARVREIGEKRPNVQKILGSAGSSLADAVTQVSNHYRQHERYCSSTEYFYWQWNMLDHDKSEHTGTKCRACQEQNLQAAVYGLENIDAFGNPNKGARKKKTARREACSPDFGGFVCPGYGMLEAASAQEMLAVIADTPCVAKFASKHRKAGLSEGKAIAKKVNEEHQVDAAMLDWQGGTNSLGAMQDRRMGAFNTVTDSKKKAAQRKQKEESGERKRRTRAGAWGKDETNRRLLFLELDK